MTKKKTFKLVISSILIAFALALSFFESLVFAPILPLPGIKLGLANIVILFSFYSLGPKSTFFIILIKCILSAIFGGGPISFAFSICGSLFSFFVMLIAKRCPHLSIYGVSILGASAHSTGQIFVAVFLFSSFAIISYLPLMLIFSVITGTLTAFISQFILLRLSDMYKK